MLPSLGAQRRAIRALERRFGQSIMPYAFTYRRQTGAYRVTDGESGSWLEFQLSSTGRLIVTAEYDGAA